MSSIWNKVKIDNSKHQINFVWLTLVLAIIILEIFLVPHFVPTITMETPQDEKYLLPWKYTLNMSDFPVRIDLEVYDLVFPDRATPWVNDVVVYSFNITNLTNRTLEINHTLSVVNPIFESFENISVTLENGTAKSLDREKVVFKNEGMNEVDIVFNITDVERIKMEHYIWTVTRQTENSILFGKYGQILTLVVLVPSTIIAIKNLKGLVLESPDGEAPRMKYQVRKTYSRTQGTSQGHRGKETMGNEHSDRIKNLIQIIESNFNIKDFKLRVYARGILFGLVPNAVLIGLIIWLFFIVFQVASLYLSIAEPRDVTLMGISIATLTIGLFTFVNKLTSDIGRFFLPLSEGEITNWHLKKMRKCCQTKDIPLLSALVKMKSKQPDISLMDIFDENGNKMFSEEQLLRKLYE